MARDGCMAEKKREEERGMYRWRRSQPFHLDSLELAGRVPKRSREPGLSALTLKVLPEAAAAEAAVGAVSLELGADSWRL